MALLQPEVFSSTDSSSVKPLSKYSGVRTAKV